MPSRSSDKSDLSFEIAFCESVLKREPECLEILEMLEDLFQSRVGVPLQEVWDEDALLFHF